MVSVRASALLEPFELALIVCGEVGAGEIAERLGVLEQEQTHAVPLDWTAEFGARAGTEFAIRYWHARTVEVRGHLTQAAILFGSLASELDAGSSARGPTALHLARIAILQGQRDRVALELTAVSNAMTPHSADGPPRLVARRMRALVTSLKLARWIHDLPPLKPLPSESEGATAAGASLEEGLTRLWEARAALAAGHRQPAEEFLEKAPQWNFQPLDTPWGDPVCLELAILKAELELLLGRQAEAHTTLEAVQLLAQKPGGILYLARHQYFVGKVAFARGDISAARQHFTQSYHTAFHLALGQVGVLAPAVRELGRSLAIGVPECAPDFQGALRYLNEALDISLGARNRRVYLETLLIKAQIYRGLDDFAKADEILAQAQLYRDRELPGFDFSRLHEATGFHSLETPVVEAVRRGELEGCSLAFMKLADALDKAGSAPDANVLIVGETGTGKRLAAEYIHRAGARASGPFISLNCAALPVELIESELFGTVKGAATGATDRPGKFELADGGTLFLDEIGELSLAAQAKILQAVEEKKFFRLGGRQPTRVNVRIIAATNRNLPVEISQGRFRTDLWYRISLLIVRMPTLGERPEDIGPIALSILRRSQTGLGGPRKALSPMGMDFLKACRWPGNVRQLSHLLQRAVLASGSELTLTLETLRKEYESLPEQVANPQAKTTVESSNHFRAPVLTPETHQLLSALERAEGNISKAARELGMPIRTLNSRVKRHSLRAHVENFKNRRRASRK